MNTIFNQYLVRAVLTSTALVLVVLLALAGLIEFIAQLEDIRNDFDTPQAILYTALRLPGLAFEMLPVSALIGSLLGLGALAAKSEIIVMRSAGLSVWRLGGMVAWAGLVMLTLAGLVGEFIGPPLDYYARNMRAEARSGQTDGRFGNETWVKDGPVYLHLQRVNPEFEFGSLYLFRFDAENRLDAIAKAENAGIDGNDNWRLENFRETRFRDDGVHVITQPLAVESFGVNTEMLGSAMARTSSLSARGLISFIDYLERNSLDTRAYTAELWYRIARTVSIMIMPVLALAFVFGSLRSGGAGSRLIIGVVIGLAYYLASEMLANSGQVFNLNPALIAWLPTIVLLGVTVFALARVR